MYSDSEEGCELEFLIFFSLVGVGVKLLPCPDWRNERVVDGQACRLSNLGTFLQVVWHVWLSATSRASKLKLWKLSQASMGPSDIFVGRQGNRG
jgi:hypothetical protein